MKSKKRGPMQVLLVMFLLFLVPVAYSEDLSLNNLKYTTLGTYSEESGLDIYCDNSNVYIDYKFTYGEDVDVGGDCSFGDRYEVPADEGCWFVVTERDKGEQNDGAWAKVKVGEMFYYESEHEPNNIDSGISCDSPDAWDCVLDYQFSYANGLLCADDHYWHECTLDKDGDGAQGTITWADNYLYNCTLDGTENYPLWEKLDNDYDHDGYVSSKDCDDNPTDDPINCPTLDKETGVVDCQYPLHSKCAICINPAAAEVCGDKINNDCGGPVQELIQLEGKTSDDCNKNQYAFS